jgi:hypothetical protein
MFDTVHNHWYHSHKCLREVSKNRSGNYKRMSVYIVSYTVYYDLRHSIICFNYAFYTVSIVYNIINIVPIKAHINETEIILTNNYYIITRIDMDIVRH